MTIVTISYSNGILKNYITFEVYCKIQKCEFGNIFINPLKLDIVSKLVNTETLTPNLFNFYDQYIADKLSFSYINHK